MPKRILRTRAIAAPRALGAVYRWRYTRLQHAIMPKSGDPEQGKRNDSLLVHVEAVSHLAERLRLVLGGGWHLLQNFVGDFDVSLWSTAPIWAGCNSCKGAE